MFEQVFWMSSESDNRVIDINRYVGLLIFAVLIVEFNMNNHVIDINMIEQVCWMSSESDDIVW